MKNLAVQRIFPRIYIMKYLGNNKKSKTECKDLIKDLNLDKFGLSKILSELCIKGLIEKIYYTVRIKPSESYFYIILTKKGRKFVRLIKSKIEKTE